MRHFLERLMQDTDILTHRLLHPGERIHNQYIQLQHLQERLTNSWSHHIETKYWKLHEMNQHLASNKPSISELNYHQQELAVRMHRAMTHYTKALEVNLQHKQSHLLHLDPQAVLARGYSISYTADGVVLRTSDQIDIGHDIRVQFAKGWCQASVSKKNK